MGGNFTGTLDHTPDHVWQKGWPSQRTQIHMRASGPKIGN